MINKLAWFVLVLNALGLLALACTPFIIRAQTYYEYKAMGAESAVDQMTAVELRSRAPDLVLGGLLCMTGVWVGIGLLLRREWARRGWLVLSVIWVSVAVFSNVFEFGWGSVFSSVFRLCILVVSFRLLRHPMVRAQFATERALPRRG